MIKACGLARSFSSHGRVVDAVRGVDLDVAPGELVAFLGPNGAGKTTTLRMLTTMLRPTAGTASIAGFDLLTEQTAIRRKIGSVAQAGGTVPERKICEEIEFQARLYGLSKSEARSRVGPICEQLDLAGLEDRFSSALSGGQRRRLDVALGLVHTPPLLFLDEPTTGLDPQSRSNLWNHIRRIRAEQGCTVFLTTHYLDEADALAERVLVIDNGVIVAVDTPEALKAKVSDDEVTISVPLDRVPDAARIATNLEGATRLTVDGDRIRFQAPRGDRIIPVLLRALDAEDISTLSIQVRRPTLDDVFFMLTGRSLRDDGDELPARPSPEGNEEVTYVA